MNVNKKIPTVLGIGLVLVLLIVVGISVQGMGQVTKLFNFASESSTPKNITVANVADNSFTVWWLTDKEDSGVVVYGKTSALSDGVAVDERDLTKTGGKYKVHFVRVSGLMPKTKYYFKIKSGTETLSVITSEKINLVAEPIYGKVTDGAGAVVVVKINGAGDLAGLIKDDGTYVISLAGVGQLPAGTSETINVFDGSETNTSLVCKVGKDRPLPTIKIGDQKNCDEQVITPTQSPSPSGGFKVPKVSSSGPQINISSGETVSTTLPTISGKAAPNQTVKIEIHSATPRTAVVTADPAGNWTWTPPSDLEPGQHTVTITVVGADGKQQTVTKSFYVQSGSPILPITNGTPSAELTHKTCVNLSCTTVSGLGSDTCSIDNDCVATASATPTLTPTPTTPDTGAVENTIVFIVGGVILLVLGIILRYGSAI